MDRPYGISDFAFPTRWDRESGPDLVKKAGRSSQRDREHAKRSVTRDRIPLAPTALSTAQEPTRIRGSYTHRLRQVPRGAG